MQIKKVLIPLDQYSLQADLYLNNKISPIIIMAHGLGGEKSCSLDIYIDYYISLGYSVCCFDHRGYGKSTGKYKNLVDKNSQLKDWKTVINYLKIEYNLIDQQLILWGYSFSGGHVLTLASQNKYRAVIANFPHVDGFASLVNYPVKYMLPATILAISDFIFSLFGKIINIKVVSNNRFAILSGKDCYDGYYSLIPENQHWDNQVPARIIATIAFYRPISVAYKIQCPTLIVGAKLDSLIPIERTRKTARKSKNIQYFEEYCGHFDLFHQPFMNHIQLKHRQFLNNL